MNFRDERLGQREPLQTVAKPLAVSLQRRRVVHRQRAQLRGEGVVRADEFAIRRGGHDKARRHREAVLREQREIRALAAADLGLRGGGIVESEEVIHFDADDFSERTSMSANAASAKPASTSTK